MKWKRKKSTKNWKRASETERKEKEVMLMWLHEMRAFGNKKSKIVKMSYNPFQSIVLWMSVAYMLDEQPDELNLLLLNGEMALSNFWFSSCCFVVDKKACIISVHIFSLIPHINLLYSSFSMNFDFIQKNR